MLIISELFITYYIMEQKVKRITSFSEEIGGKMRSYKAVLLENDDVIVCEIGQTELQSNNLAFVKEGDIIDYYWDMGIIRILRVVYKEGAV